MRWLAALPFVHALLPGCCRCRHAVAVGGRKRMDTTLPQRRSPLDGGAPLGHKCFRAEVGPASCVASGVVAACGRWGGRWGGRPRAPAGATGWGFRLGPTARGVSSWRDVVAAVLAGEDARGRRLGLPVGGSSDGRPLGRGGALGGVAGGGGLGGPRCGCGCGRMERLLPGSHPYPPSPCILGLLTQLCAGYRIEEKRE